MNKLIIPESHFGVTKTLRIPEDMVDKIMHFLSVPKSTKSIILFKKYIIIFDKSIE